MTRISLNIFAVVVLIGAPALAGLDKGALNAEVEAFNVEYRAIRADFLTYPTYSLKVGDYDHLCVIPATFRRLGEAGESFRIRKVHTKRDHFIIELETPGKTRLQILAYDRSKLSQIFLDKGLSRLLNDVFVFGPSPAPVHFIGHIESRLLHIDRCNHLPKKEFRDEYPTRDEGVAAGYRPCALCFEITEVLPFRGYLGHRIGGLRDVKTFELVYPPSLDDELQARLNRLGTEVLANWPMELSGFDYEFLVVQAKLPLAVSFRTGIVVVSDTFLKTADADEEILFVLAHEIAHCELHLPPRSPYEDMMIVDPLSSESLAFKKWVGSQQFVADLMAINWFQAHPNGRWELQRARVALAKVHYALGLADQLGSEEGFYVNMHERLWLFEPDRFKSGDLRQVFLAIDGEGDVRHELRFLGLLRDEAEKKTIPFFLVTTSDYQDDPVMLFSQFPRGEIKDCNGKNVRFYAQYFICQPGFSTIIFGETESGNYFDKFTNGPLQEALIIGMDGIKKWRIIEEAES